MDKVIPALVVLALPLVAAAQAPTIAKSALVTVSAESTLDAPAAKVWSELIKAGALGELTNIKIARANATFAKTGDTSPAEVQGDKGIVTVKTATPQKELRLAFDPEQGHYVCHARIRLTAMGAKTKVSFEDIYSDEKPASVDATAKNVSKEIEDNVKRFAERFAAKK